MSLLASQRGTPYPLPGPGVLIALSSSGWVGILSLITFGSDVGYSLVGITLITLFFKYALITGLGRYTLSTNQDIFVGIASVRGPKNWAVWMVIGILYGEIFMLGYSILSMARLINELLGLQIPTVLSLSLILILVFILVSINSYWFFRKILIGAVLVLGIGFCSMIFSMSFPGEELIAGLLPTIPSYASILDSAIILSSVGSGLSLLFYSIWLMSHLKGSVSLEDKQQILRSITLDAAIGMGFLFILCIIYYTIGYLFLYEHGLGAPESDLTLEIVLLVMHPGPFGNTIFVIVCLTALFCSVFGGIYGRSRVLRITLPRLIPDLDISTRTYYVIIGVLVLSAFSSHLFWSMELTRTFISLRLLFFSLLTGILMAVDRTLPRDDRGSGLWYFMMSMGSVFSLFIGLALCDQLF
jgi:hypothetical protein